MSTINNATDIELIRELQHRGYAVRVWELGDVMAALADFTDMNATEAEALARNFIKSGRLQKWADYFGTEEEDWQSLADYATEA